MCQSMILGFNYIYRTYTMRHHQKQKCPLSSRLKANYYVSDLSAKTPSTWTVYVILTTVNQRI